jgi:proteic killer suppression protein
LVSPYGTNHGGRRSIRSFTDKLTQAVDDGSVKKGFSQTLCGPQQILTLLNSATDLNDLRSPPGNRLDQLSGNRDGKHSIRINKQWRICFKWTDAGPEDVEITDYH